MTFPHDIRPELNWLEQDRRDADTTTFYGVQLTDLSRDELLAVVQHYSEQAEVARTRASVKVDAWWRLWA